MSDEAPLMSYDEAGIVECDIGETSYRIDSGRQGTALALSSRPVDSWDWTFVTELKWDGSDLKCRTLDFETRSILSAAFKQALEDLE